MQASENPGIVPQNAARSSQERLGPVRVECPGRRMRERRTSMAREGRSMRTLTALTIAALTMLAAGAAFAQGSIKIGFLAPLSGAIAQAGKDLYNGCELFWEEGGWEESGRQVGVGLRGNQGH